MGAPDLLSTEIDMHLINGFELIKRLAEKGNTHPIVVYSYCPLIDTFGYSGKIEYIKKPYYSREVARRIKKILNLDKIKL